MDFAADTMDGYACALATVTSRIREAAGGDGLIGTATAHHLAGGGSLWRARLALACGGALGLEERIAAGLAVACELAHQASLSHDDVQDGTALRRGRPSVAARFGPAAAICVGDHLLAAAFGALAESGPRLVPWFARRVSEIVAGQAEEFSPGLWRGMDPACWQALAEAKSGAMAALPIEGAARVAGLPEEECGRTGRAARLLGAAYQAGDDIADVQEDLARGSLNGVVAHGLAAMDGAARAALLSLLRRAQGRAHGGAVAAEAAGWAVRLYPAQAACLAHAHVLLAECRGTVRGSALRQVIQAEAVRIEAGLDAAVAAARHPRAA